MRCVISQPRYLPAFNYLQRLANCDFFVILDDVQHQKRCLEHRNKILFNQNIQWLSLSIDRKKTSRPLIQDMHIIPGWLKEHENRIRQAYQSSLFYDDKLFRKIYDEETSKSFILMVRSSLKNILSHFKIKPPQFILSSSLNIHESGSKKLAKICQILEAKEYISGPNGRDYLQTNDFDGCQILYHDYEFPIYAQPFFPFMPWLCWLDGYFNAGQAFVSAEISKPLCLKK